MGEESEAVHELSIARAIVAEVESSARERGIEAVGEVRLRIGALCGVVGDSLEFCFALAAEGSVLERASLVVDRSPVSLWCRSCSATVAPRDSLVFVCPRCGEPCPDLVSGRELEIVGYSSLPATEGASA